MKKVVTIVLASVLLLVAFFALYVYVINRPLPQNEHDVAILERTIELLADENDWSRNDDRNCSESQKNLSLYCALRQASVNVTGDFKHRAAALQEVRYEIEIRKPGVEYAHRLMDYNNDKSVDFEDMHNMLQTSLRNLRLKWQEMDNQEVH